MKIYYKKGGIYLLVGVFLITVVMNSLASEVLSSSAIGQVPITNEPIESNVDLPIRLSNREIWLSFGVLAFGVLALLLEFTLVRGFVSSSKPQDILNLFTVTLIVVGTLFLISSGISSSQIAPALGLYGTIVGYLLGRESERRFQKTIRDVRDDEKSADIEER